MSTPAERVAAILAEATDQGKKISFWERGFLSSVKNYETISAKQEAILAKIEVRLEIVKDEEEDGTLNDYPF